MNVINSARYEVAMHPGVIVALEHLSDTLLTAGVSLAETAAIDSIPLGVFLKPLVAAAVNDARAAIQARINAALNEYIQAQPTVKAGDGHAGLISIEEVATMTVTKIVTVHETPAVTPVAIPMDTTTVGSK